MTRISVKTPDSNLFSTLLLLLGLNATVDPVDPGDPEPNIVIKRTATTYSVTATILADAFGGDEFRIAIIVKGTGFTYAQGEPNGGTATSISLRFAGVEDTRIDQFSIPLKALFEALSEPITTDGGMTDLANLLGTRLNIFGNIQFIGNAGDDFGPGAAGTDTLSGGAGDDNLFGFNGDDRLIGSIGDDDLQGGFGKDRVDGGVGNDDLKGGAGDDFIIGGFGLDTADGGTGNDIIFGLGGNDDLNGSFGNDTLVGGPGDDELDGANNTDTASYFNSAAGVTVDLSLSGPQNTTGAGMDSLEDIENLIGSQFNDTLSGSDSNNLLDGRQNNDLLGGGFGSDTLKGGTGDDTLDGGLNNDRLEGEDGDDQLIGAGSLDRLFGGEGNDTLSGGTQRDRLDGGAGADTLTGGAQNDVFVFSELSAPRITDFTQGQDKIDMSPIDARTGPAGNQAFNFIGAVAFGGTQGELRAFISGADTRIEGDRDGDGNLDFVILLTGNFTLAANDFIL